MDNSMQFSHIDYTDKQDPKAVFMTDDGKPPLILSFLVVHNCFLDREFAKEFAEKGFVDGLSKSHNEPERIATLNTAELLFFIIPSHHFPDRKSKLEWIRMTRKDGHSYLRNKQPNNFNHPLGYVDPPIARRDGDMLRNYVQADLTWLLETPRDQYTYLDKLFNVNGAHAFNDYLELSPVFDWTAINGQGITRNSEDPLYFLPDDALSKANARYFQDGRHIFPGLHALSMIGYGSSYWRIRSTTQLIPHAPLPPPSP